VRTEADLQIISLILSAFNQRHPWLLTGSFHENECGGVGVAEEF
jgi:hypothetical protein